MRSKEDTEWGKGGRGVGVLIYSSEKMIFFQNYLQNHFVSIKQSKFESKAPRSELMDELN